MRRVPNVLRNCNLGWVLVLHSMYRFGLGVVFLFLVTDGVSEGWTLVCSDNLSLTVWFRDRWRVLVGLVFYREHAWNLSLQENCKSSSWASMISRFSS